MAAGAKRLRRGFPCADRAKELLDLRLECPGEPFEDRDGRVFETALHTANIGAVDLGIERQVFLRQTATDS